ncbi:14813_t:CDS:2, partial [Racocetra persica]
MDNLTLLTEGSRIYSEKRKRKNDQIPEIVFDETARREYLTGFHKRKLERQAKAKQTALEREKKEKAEAKKAAKEARMKQIEEKLAATQAMINKFLKFISKVPGCCIQWSMTVSLTFITYPSLAQISEYKTPQILTTVTVIEDFNVSENTEFVNTSKKIKLDADNKMSKNEGGQDMRLISKIK